ncbi:MAG: DNA repair protein RecN [Bacilli bacterium]|nr:DNA repair protein RecN [Bacilli bacterium]MDY5745080.1 DNA repair protein RecN [Bacilli bacterium]
MLANLRIENFAIIEDIDINFSKGMNVLMGETGAGKSIIIDALDLLSGGRSTFSKLRDDSKKAFIEGRFVFEDDFIEKNEEIKEYLEGNELVISRVLFPNKTSSCRINGLTTSLSNVQKIMKKVIDIHSQGDNSLLLDERNYLSLLDNYLEEKDYDELKNKVSANYKKINLKRKEIEDYKKETNLVDEDYLRYQVEEISRFNLKENEIEDLNEELYSLDEYSKINDSFKAFKDFYYGNNSISVDSFLSSLKGFITPLNKSLLENEASKAIESIYELENNLDEMFSKYDKLDFSEERIDEINRRLYELSGLQHKFGKRTSDILARYEDYKTKLDNISNYQENLDRLENELEALRDETMKDSIKLSSLREKRSSKLIKAINDELNDLGIKEGGFSISLERKELSAFGIDQVNFMISLNKGMKFVSLKEAASGGENSRLMLALKTVFNKINPYDVMIFDEIDVGISGNIAFKVSKKIEEISSSSQVIVISHLVQVVANGDNHLFVYKEDGEEKTTSHIKYLTEEELVNEVAKMLSLDKVSESSLASSRELINSFKR